MFRFLSLLTAKSSPNSLRGAQFSGSLKICRRRGWTRHHSGDHNSSRDQNSDASPGAPKNTVSTVDLSQENKWLNSSCGNIMCSVASVVLQFLRIGHLYGYGVSEMPRSLAARMWNCFSVSWGCLLPAFARHDQRSCRSRCDAFSVWVTLLIEMASAAAAITCSSCKGIIGSKSSNTCNCSNSNIIQASAAIVPFILQHRQHRQHRQL